MKRVLRWVLKVVQGDEPEGFTAFGKTIWFVDNPSAGLRTHEAIHREQQAAEPVLYYVKYAWYHVTRGYRLNPFELEAVAAQDKVDAEERERLSR